MSNYINMIIRSKFCKWNIFIVIFILSLESQGFGQDRPRAQIRKLIETLTCDQKSIRLLRLGDEAVATLLLQKSPDPRAIRAPDPETLVFALVAVAGQEQSLVRPVRILLRIEPHRRTEAFNRFGGLAGITQNIAVNGKSFGIVGTEVNGAPGRLDGRVQIAAPELR